MPARERDFQTSRNVRLRETPIVPGAARGSLHRSHIHITGGHKAQRAQPAGYAAYRYARHACLTIQRTSNDDDHLTTCWKRRGNERGLPRNSPLFEYRPRKRHSSSQVGGVLRGCRTGRVSGDRLGTERNGSSAWCVLIACGQRRGVCFGSGRRKPLERRGQPSEDQGSELKAPARALPPPEHGG